MSKLSRLLGLKSEEKAAIPAAAASGAAGKAGDKAPAENEGDEEPRAVPIERILPNPFQPRKLFEKDKIEELANSIRQYGIVQPLIVRPKENGYEIIAGERRYRAAVMVGLKEVPVVIRSVPDREMAELAIVENLQREDLHYLEEAEGLQQLIANFGLTQDELARRMGKNQSTIANKLRLLKLAPEIRAELANSDLTERHARALLKLEDSSLQERALRQVIQEGLNVRQTEDLVEKIIKEAREAEESRKPGRSQQFIKVVRDLRIYLNSFRTIIEEMQKAGLKASMRQSEESGGLVLTITIRAPGKGRGK